MNRTIISLIAAVVPPLLLGSLTLSYSQQQPPPGLLTFADEAGYNSTLSLQGLIDPHNPFFVPLGTNARACVTCHQANNGWSLRPDTVQARFDATQGLDPLFLPVDGTNSPNADMSTLDARLAATTMLRTKGLIRIGLPVPNNAEFDVVGVDDPYGYANAGELSLFRRPLPATNIKFLTSVLWDDRATSSFESVESALAFQATNAVLGHEQGAQPPTKAQIDAIIRFETGLFTTQSFDSVAGPLNIAGASSGPYNLSQQNFAFGIDSPFENSSGANNRFGDTHGYSLVGRDSFDPNAFTLFEGWKGLLKPNDPPIVAARKAIERGEEIFNTKQFIIAGVAGLNSASRPTILGTCSTCHNTPNVGSNSLGLLMNTGISDGLRRTPDLPLYTLQNKTTGAQMQTTDPGRAMITGRWADIGEFKVPSLRGLDARFPYMHNGFSRDVNDVVAFYEQRFDFNLTIQERSDLIAFLKAL